MADPQHMPERLRLIGDLHDDLAADVPYGAKLAQTCPADGTYPLEVRQAIARKLMTGFNNIEPLTTNVRLLADWVGTNVPAPESVPGFLSTITALAVAERDLEGKP